MNHAAFQWAIGQRTGSPTAKFVLVTLAFHSDDAGLFDQPQKVLAQSTGLTARTIRSALKQLAAGGFLTRAPVFSPDEGRKPDRFQLTMKREGVACA